jgi:hypothetical protein
MRCVKVRLDVLTAAYVLGCERVAHMIDILPRYIASLARDSRGESPVYNSRLERRSCNQMLPYRDDRGDGVTRIASTRVSRPEDYSHYLTDALAPNL